MPQKQIKTQFLLPSDYSDDDANTVAEEVLNYLIERTKSGKGSDGKKFPGYSESYKKSLAFHIAGKTNKVDLTLSSEMLESLKILKASNGKVEIGYPKGSDMNGRAEGNIIGSYGGKPNESKARNFLELSAKELRNIIKGLDIIPREIQNEIGKTAKATAEDIINGFDFNLEEDE